MAYSDSRPNTTALLLDDERDNAMCNVSDVSYADVCDPERDRGRWRLALRQVRAALGCQPTGEVQDFAAWVADFDRVDRRGY